MTTPDKISIILHMTFDTMCKFYIHEIPDDHKDCSVINLIHDLEGIGPEFITLIVRTDPVNATRIKLAYDNT